MLHQFEPVADTRGTAPARRSPAVPVVCAVVVGILADSSDRVSFSVWWSAALIAIALNTVLWFSGCRRVSVVTFLIACLCLGGAWHHLRWSCLSDRDISMWATDEAKPVQIKGRILQTPLIQKLIDESVPWKIPERSTTLVECYELQGDRKGPVPVSGLARVSVIGRLDNLTIGDLVEINGKLVRPSEPSNSGDFNTRRWLRAQSVHAIVLADVPESITLTGQQRSMFDIAHVVRDGVRRRAEQLIDSRLQPKTAAVAQSLLLGSRVEMDRELRRAFAESGTLHVLAISGMNVGLLWGLLWLVCRLLRFPPRVSLLATAVLLPAYAVITDANPPVVRATIIAMVMVIGHLARRSTSHWNSLAIAALLVLAWNPADLFNAGAQLSFIAVWAILLTMGFLQSIRIATEWDDGPLGNQSLVASVLTSQLQKIIEGCIVSLVIWVLTAPLIASQFHVVSPVGVLLNVLLTPLIAVMFWLGYLFLLLGMISQTLFGWLGWPFEITLNWFLSSVESASKWPLGHVYVPPPPLWWTVGFYVVTVSFAIVDQWRGRVFWSARVALVWSVLGLAVGLQTTDTRELSCKVLSVGHGLGVLVEFPNGRTLLYDAGSLSGGSIAAQTIENSIWASGRTRLDAIVLSHADSDHCDAMPELLDVVPTNTLMLHRTCLDWSQRPVAATIEGASAAGVGIQLVAAGQHIQLDPDVDVHVLHPPARYRGRSDNANSVVLLLKYAGRQIMLTGDLEKDGLVRLLNSKHRNCDILLSPHHGSLNGNSPDLARWSTPEYVIASCRDDAVHNRLKTVYSPITDILTTARYGAITCRVSSDGKMTVEPYKRK